MVATWEFEVKYKFGRMQKNRASQSYTRGKVSWVESAAQIPGRSLTKCNSAYQRLANAEKASIGYREIESQKSERNANVVVDKCPSANSRSDAGTLPTTGPDVAQEKASFLGSHDVNVVAMRVSSFS